MLRVVLRRSNPPILRADEHEHAVSGESAGNDREQRGAVRFGLNEPFYGMAELGQRDEPFSGICRA